MNILDLVQSWATNKGWWTLKSDPSDDGYLYIAKHAPLNYNDKPWTGVADYLTLWADSAWAMQGEYPDDKNQKLEPADPDFFLNLEYLVITKTK